MTYLQFLQGYKYKKYYRLYNLIGGDARLRGDALKVLFRKIERGEKRTCSKIWYHLDEIAESPLLILHDSAFDIRVLVWVPGLLEKEMTQKLLNELPKLSGYSVIVDESMETFPIFHSMYHKSSKGVMVVCSKRPSKDPKVMESFVSLRLNLVLGISVPKTVQIDLTRDDMTISNLFNIFSILEALNKKEICLDDLRQFDLLRGDPETFLVDELFKKGRQEVLRYDFREVIPEKFFRRLYGALILKLRVKSMSNMQSTVASGKLGMGLFHYMQCREEVKKLDFQDLYRRLYLVFSLLRWRKNLGSVYLLLLHW